MKKIRELIIYLEQSSCDLYPCLIGSNLTFIKHLHTCCNAAPKYGSGHCYDAIYNSFIPAKQYSDLETCIL